MFIATGIATVFTMFHSIIVARLLNDPDALGVLSILQSLTGLFATFAVFGIPAGVTKFIAEYRVKDKKTMGDMISSSFILIFLLALGASVTFFILSGVLANDLYNKPILVLLIRIASITLILSTLGVFISSVIRGTQEMKMLAWFSIINTAASLPIAYILISLYGLVGAVIALMLNALVSLLVSLKMIIKIIRMENIKLRFHLSKKHTVSLITFSFPIFLSGFVLLPAYWFSRTYLALTSGFGDVGLFKLGFGLYSLFLVIPSVIATPLMPMLSELYASRPDKASIILPKILRVVMLLALPLVIAIALASKYLILLLYGETYVDAWFIAYIMLLTAFFASLSPITSSMFMSAGKTWQILGLDAMWVAFFMPSSYLLINLYGLSGLGAAYLFSGVVFVIIKLAYFSKRFGMDLSYLRTPSILTAVFMTISYLAIRTFQGTTLLLFDGIIVCCLLVIEYFVLFPPSFVIA